MAIVYTREFLSASDSTLLPWKHAISQGNRAFMQGDNRRARASYEMALYSIKRVLMEFLSRNLPEESMDYLDNVMAALVVTQHNMVDLFAAEGATERAVEHLCEAHQAMFVMRYHSLAEVRTLAHRHMQITRTELLAFNEKHGDHPQIRQTLLITQPVCRCCARIPLH